AVGTLLILRRQEVEMVAKVAWLSPPRCGVAFEEEIRVGEWVSGKRGTTDFEPPRCEERRVEDRRAASNSGASDSASRATDIDARLAEELGYVRRLLDLLSDELAEEPVYVQRHAK